MSGHAAHVGAAALVGVASERLRSSSPGRYPSGWRPRLRESFALVEALEAGEIAGAALDVYEREPEVHPGLLEREDVVLTPHVASATVAAREAMGMLCVEGLRAVLLEVRAPANALNPEALRGR